MNTPEGWKLVHSIIYECPALRVPQSLVERVGNAARIIALKGATEEDANTIVAALNTAAAPTPPEQPARCHWPVCPHGEDCVHAKSGQPACSAPECSCLTQCGDNAAHEAEQQASAPGYFDPQPSRVACGVGQPAAQGELTDERIDELWSAVKCTSGGVYAAIRAFARAIEREVLTTSRKRPEEEVEDWRIEYGCDTGPNDDAILEWWTVTDGLRSFQFDFKSEAEWLLERLARGQKS